MPAVLSYVFRFFRLLLSGHQGVAIENTALRMQIAAFQRKKKRLSFDTTESADSCTGSRPGSERFGTSKTLSANGSLNRDF